MLVNGTWTVDWHPVQASDAKGGSFVESSGFRNWVTPDGSPGVTGDGGFQAGSRSLSSLCCFICPWASRTLMARKLKGLESVISVSIVEPRC